MIERAFAQADLDWRFLTFEIDARRLGEALLGVDALGLHGALLIGPLREAVADCFENLTDRAKRTGSVTCLVRDGDTLVADDLIGAAAADAVDKQRPLAGQTCGAVGRRASGSLVGRRRAAARLGFVACRRSPLGIRGEPGRHAQRALSRHDHRVPALGRRGSRPARRDGRIDRLRLLAQSPRWTGRRGGLRESL